MSAGRTQRFPGGPVAEGVAVVALYALLAWALMWPLFSDLGGSVLNPNRAWLTGWYQSANPEPLARAMLRDIHLFVWVYAWDWHALTTRPGALFDANIFHPAPTALAYSEHALGKLATAGPLFALSGNAVFAYQGDLLLSFALSGAAMYALLRTLGAARAACFIAGVVYAFCPARVDSLYHTYLLAGQYLPLSLLFLDRALFGARRRDALACATFLLLQMLSSYYLAYQTVIALAAYGVAVLWTMRGRIPLRGTLRVASALGVVGAVFALVSVPYVRVRSTGAIFGYGKMVDALVPTSNPPLLNYIDSPFLLRAHLVPALERGGYAYVGIVVLLLVVLGLVRPGPSSPAVRRLRAGALAIALAAWLMALGPFLITAGGRIPMPYQLAMTWIPGFDSMRVPSRFALTMMLGVAVLAGLGADRLLRRVPASAARGWGGVLAGVACAALVCLDYGYGFERFATRPLRAGANGPPIYTRLAELPSAPLLEFPLSGLDGLRASESMVHSTAHWMPLLDGSSGYAPSSLRIVLALAHRLPDPRALDLLGRLTGLRYVIVHRGEMGAPERRYWQDPPGLRLVAVAGGDELYAVVHPPEPDLLPALRACAADGTACAPLLEMASS